MAHVDYPVTRCSLLVEKGLKEENKMKFERLMLMSITRAIAGAALVAALFAAPVRAEEGGKILVITQAWSRATPGGAKIAGGYLTIENMGNVPDRLIGGSSDIAGKVEVHEMAMNNGVMTMRPLDKGLVIEPGKTVKLAPGGYHLMLFDLKSPLKQGDKVPVMLEFEKAGKVGLLLDVQGVGAQGPAGAGDSGRNMDMKKTPDHPGMKM
jgi:copper(I)-binding protein